MKEEYVTYECAVKLKELGFAEKVNHGYLKKISIEPELSFGNLKEVHSKDPKNYNDNRKGAGKGSFFCSAPRLDQAQKWLREVKGIHVEPCFRYGTIFKLVVQSETKVLYKILEKGYKSYELALSAGIDAALELLTDKSNDK